MQSEKIAEGNELIRDMCEEMQISCDEILGKSRRRSVSDPRAVVIAALRFGKEIVFTDIAKIMNRHHSTIMYSVDTYKDVLRSEYEIVLLKCLTVKERESYYKNLSSV